MEAAWMKYDGALPLQFPNARAILIHIHAEVFVAVPIRVRPSSLTERGTAFSAEWSDG